MAEKKEERKPDPDAVAFGKLLAEAKAPPKKPGAKS